jgi:hypothetical protein
MNTKSRTIAQSIFIFGKHASLDRSRRDVMRQAVHLTLHVSTGLQSIVIKDL